MSTTVEQLWENHRVKLLAFIRSRVGDAHAAEDILQDVFVKIHRRLDSLRDRSKVESWIYRITRNSIVDHYRGRKSDLELPDTLAAPRTDSGDRVRQEIQEWLVPMIQALPGQYRDTLVLADIERLSQKEVAAMQGLSLPGAKARIQRGRRMLKEELLACCQFDFDHKGNVIGYESRGGNTCDQC